MQFDFATLLVIATFVTGAVWLLDVLIWAPKRGKALVGRMTTQTGGVDRHSPAKLPWYIDFSRSFFPVILAVLILRSFIVEPFRIPSGSMEPTLLPGDFILVNKFSYGLRLPVVNTKVIELGEPERGDVVVFRYPEDPAVAFIKRIVGLPGDRLEYRDKQLYINGKPVGQDILPAGEKGGKSGYNQIIERLSETREHRIFTRQGSGNGASWEYTVPEGHYFTLGDNRDNSRDSRFWGPLPEQNLIGKAFLIWMNWQCVTGNGNCERIGSTIE